MRHVGSKIFYKINGVWTDRAFTGELEVTKLEYASDEYFDFLEKHPDLDKYFALGERVIIALGDGKAVVVEAAAP